MNPADELPMTESAAWLHEQMVAIEIMRQQLPKLEMTQRFSDDQIESIYSMGYAAQMQGQYEKASGIFALLGIYRPLEARFVRALALSCKLQGRFAEATDLLARAMLLEPTRLRTALDLVDVLLKSGRPADAVPVLEPLIVAAGERNELDIAQQAQSMLNLLRRDKV